MAQKKTFESALARLEEIVNEIEDTETGLDKSVKLYTEGVDLSAYCAKQLKAAEQKVTFLNEKYEGIFEQKKFDYSEE
jgi:exodeoxyribonuclease VII, small subunit